MKTKLSRVFHSKTTTVMFAFALFMFGIFLWGADKNTAYASVHMTSDVLESTFEDYIWQEYSGSQAKEYVGIQAPECEKKGYVFSGWFTRNDCVELQCVRDHAVYKSTVLDDSATYYARFVAEEVLDVKVQVSNEEDVNPDKDGNQKYMRLISSVEASGYAQVGFQVKYLDENNEWKYKKNSSQLVYKRVDSSVYEGNPAYSFSPKVVDTESEFFITSTWKGPDNTGIEDYNKEYCVRAYWKTFDGLTMAGTFRYVCVNDGLNTNIVNLTLKDTENNFYDEYEEYATSNGGEYTKLTVNYADIDVSYTDLAAGVTSDTATATVIYHDGTYAYLRMDLGTGINRETKLHSATWFTFTDDDDISQKVIWRNLYSSHTNIRQADTDKFSAENKVTNHHEDHTWYDIYLAFEQAKSSDYYSNDNEFVIASSADLYGFAELGRFNADRDGKSDRKCIKFENMTIYFCNDITINQGTADKDTGWTKADGVSKIYEWYAVSNFAGTLDGQDHVISGLYARSDWDGTEAGKATSYHWAPGVGLLAHTAQTAVVRKFNIVNSFYPVNYDGAGGVLASGAGTFEELYTSVVIDALSIKQPGNSNLGHGRSGGIVGQANLGTVTVSNCWSECHIKSDMGYLGGIVGNLNTKDAHTVVQHCLFTGSIEYSGNTASHAGGMVGKASVVSGAVANVTIKDCLNVGQIRLLKFNNSRGGNILGSAGVENNASINNVSITNTYTTGNVDETTYLPLNPIGWIANASSPIAQPTDVTRELSELEGVNAFNSIALSYGDGSSGTYWVLRDNHHPMLEYFLEDDDSKLNIQDEIKDVFVIVDGIGTISNLDQLKSFRAQQNNGQLDDAFASGAKAVLTNNIEINPNPNAEGWANGTVTKPASPWVPIKGFKGIFEGQGYAITGLYTRSGNDDNGIGLFTNTDGATIQNLEISNSFLEVNTGRGTGALVGNGSGTFKTIRVDVIIADTKDAGVLDATASCNYVGSIMGKATGDVTIIDCWSSSSIDSGYIYVGGLLGRAEGANVTISHCLNTGDITHYDSALPNATHQTAATTKTINHGGLLGGSASVTSVTITDSLNQGTVKSISVDTINGYGMIAGPIPARTGANNKTLTLSNIYALQNAVGAQDIIYDYAGTAADALVTTDKITDINAHYYTKLNLRRRPTATSYWSTRTGDTPMLVSFLKDTDQPIALSEYKPNELTVINNIGYIYGAEQLADFSTKASTLASATKLYLASNIVMNEGWDATTGEEPATKFTTIHGYQGAFYGQGYTISGIYAEHGAAGTGTGLFSETESTTLIQNLRVTNSYFKANNNQGTAAIVGRGAGTFLDIYVDAVVYDDLPSTTSAGEVLHTGNLGGILGVATGDVTIGRCWSNCTITSENRVNLGGIIGNTESQIAEIKHCLYTGTIKVGATCAANNAYAGGIVGKGGADASTAAVLVEDSFSSGIVKSYSATAIHAIGGVIGRGTSYVTIKDSYSVRNYPATDATLIAEGVTAASEGITGKLATDAAGTVSVTLAGTVAARGPVALTGLNAKNANGAPTLNYKTATNTGGYWVCIEGGTPKLAFFATASDVIVE